MQRVYLAGPYRDQRGEWFVHQNIQKASEVAVELWKMGLAVFCPHRNTAFFGGSCDDNVWLEGDLDWLRVADYVVVLPGWEESTGTRAEIREAEESRIPVFYWPYDRQYLELL